MPVTYWHEYYFFHCCSQVQEHTSSGDIRLSLIYLIHACMPGVFGCVFLFHCKKHSYSTAHFVLSLIWKKFRSLYVCHMSSSAILYLQRVHVRLSLCIALWGSVSLYVSLQDLFCLHELQTSLRSFYCENTRCTVLCCIIGVMTILAYGGNKLTTMGFSNRGFGEMVSNNRMCPRACKACTHIQFKMCTVEVAEDEHRMCMYVVYYFLLVWLL